MSNSRSHRFADSCNWMAIDLVMFESGPDLEPDEPGPRPGHRAIVLTYYVTINMFMIQYRNISCLAVWVFFQCLFIIIFQYRNKYEYIYETAWFLLRFVFWFYNKIA
jgi:hypothetical protein